jgi:hypothetical protein
MTAELPAEGPDLTAAAALLTQLGFVARSDLPDRPGPAYLAVAIRPHPTLTHFDPEQIEYWVTRGGRGSRVALSGALDERLATDFSWGDIRLVDRLGSSNEYLTFGGRLVAERREDAVVAVFTSQAPILRRGGHSQVWDEGAEAVGAFFGRVLLTVDFVPGFEARWAVASPLARYAAFVADAIASYRTSEPLRTAHASLWNLLRAAAARLRSESAADWGDGEALLGDIATR